MTDESIPQSAASRQNKVSWSFPNLALHEPNTESITDEELQQAVISKWPADKDGVVKIPYTFAGLPYFLQPYQTSISGYRNYGIKPVESCDSTYLDTVKDSIENGLKSWEVASNGKIQFYEDRLGLKSSGLSFYLANDEALYKDEMGAFTQCKMDNSGYLDQVAVVYPNSKNFWDVNSTDNYGVAYVINIITHELGHAIGSRHFHEYPSMLAKLQKMKDGVFASVMPYQSKITNDKNAENICHPVPNEADSCNPPHATIPGPLDKRFVQLNYKNNIPPQESTGFIP